METERPMPMTEVERALLAVKQIGPKDFEIPFAATYKKVDAAKKAQQPQRP